jgi:hypothetical protein
MMKLRHGPSFCSNAGSAWRLIFVYALFPWLQKYRIEDMVEDSNVDDKEVDEPLSETVRRSVVNRADTTRLERQREEITALRRTVADLQLQLQQVVEE